GGGGGRWGGESAWVHIWVVPVPWVRLGEGELLMTVGYPIPEDPAEQGIFIERLAQAGVSGILICDQAYAPPLDERMLSAADAHSLPVLLTAYEVPFTTISRTVGEANRSAEHARLLQVLRVYETVRLAMGGESSADLFEKLGGVLECDFFVLDPHSGDSLLENQREVPAEISAALAQEMARRRDPMPAILRLSGRPGSAAFLAPASRPAALVAVARGDDMPDLSILHHVTAVATLEVEKLVAEYERRRRLGSELLAGMIDGRVPEGSADQLLSERRLCEQTAILACCTGEGQTGENSEVHVRLELRGVPHLLLRRAPLLTALIPDTPDAVSAFREEMDASFPIGLSDPVGNVSRVPDAHREAQWALRGAQSTGETIARYGQNSALSPFMPSSLSDAESAVQQILGPLIAYDETHDSRLVESLQTFLQHNRSWRKAAEVLCIHKQTLVYRMRRAAEITSRRLDSTQDVAELWLALKAAEASGLQYKPRNSAQDKGSPAHP
ncbi:MAG: PucR family transcriptional regulator, partial [Rubrobacter sp.]|nr:PucR family transcriptional regulator [Rubrobacter sp.]